MLIETEAIRNLLMAGFLITLVLYVYYYVMFGEWLNYVTRTLTLVNVRANEKVVQMDRLSSDGYYVIEVLFIVGNEDGYFARFEVNRNPELFTNNLLLAYWIGFVIRNRISIFGRIRIVTYVCYRFPHYEKGGYRTNVATLQYPE